MTAAQNQTTRRARVVFYSFACFLDCAILPPQLHMRYRLLLGFFLFISPTVVSADTSILSTDPLYATSFTFYCDPYKFSFEEGQHYMPRNSFCDYSIPSTITSRPVIGVYKGEVGSAEPVGGDLVYTAGTLVRHYSNIFGTPQNETNFFAVVHDTSIDQNSEFYNYLTNGAPLPTNAVENQTYYILKWKWGPKPVEEYDPVVVIPGILGSWEKDGKWILDPVLHTYDNLVDTFKANGYVEGETLFTFAYDWRKSNVTTATLFAEKMESIKTICKCSHVDIVGHSMGGLVAAQYIASEGYKNDVDQLFFVATPLMGAPLAYQAWEGGEINFGNKFENVIMGRIFKNEAKENGFKTIFDYIRNKPISGLQELLPTYNYLISGGTLLSYPSGYPRNTFLENLVPKYWNVFSQTRVTTIMADDLNQNTVSMFSVASSTKPDVWEHGEPTTVHVDQGDGTVPHQSIQNITEPDLKLDLVNHTLVASTSAPHIFSTLNNKKAEVVVGKTYNIFKNADWKVLFIKLFSPIDMQIVAPDGKRLGKDFVTGAELQEIPDAFYSGFNTDDEYAVISNPLPGTYHVQTVGTGSGSYTILADYMDESGSHEAEATGTTTTGESGVYALTISVENPSVVITKETPPAPPTEVTPESCIADITQAYKNNWIKKRGVYAALVAECRVLKNLFQTQAFIEKIIPQKQDKLKNALFKATRAAITRALDNMDRLAKDKGNTKDAVELISKITTWFRENKLER